MFRTSENKETETSTHEDDSRVTLWTMTWCAAITGILIAPTLLAAFVLLGIGLFAHYKAEEAQAEDSAKKAAIQHMHNILIAAEQQTRAAQESNVVAFPSRNNGRGA